MGSAGSLTCPGGVLGAITSTSLLVRGDVQALIDALEGEPLAVEVDAFLGGELFSRVQVDPMEEDHRVKLVALELTVAIDSLTEVVKSRVSISQVTTV